MTSDEDIRKFAEAHPELVPMLNAMAQDPVKLAALRATTKLNAQDPRKLQDKLFESLSICAICGIEQKTFTLGKAAVTQHICHTCKVKLSRLPREDQQKALEAGLKKDFLGQAEARFAAQQQYLKKQRKKQEEGDKKKEKQGITFKVTREPKNEE